MIEKFGWSQGPGMIEKFGWRQGPGIIEKFKGAKPTFL